MMLRCQILQLEQRLLSSLLLLLLDSERFWWVIWRCWRRSLLRRRVQETFLTLLLKWEMMKPQLLLVKRASLRFVERESR